jgi:hypothetical protein
VRRPFATITTISSVILIATTVLWIRSFFAIDYIRYFGPMDRDNVAYYAIGSNAGYLRLEWTRYHFAAEERDVFAWSTGWDWRVDGWRSDASYQRALTNYGRGWLSASHQRRRTNTKPLTTEIERDIRVAYWLVIPWLLISPVLWLRGRLRQRRRLHSGRCTSCGYDLRGSGSICPECGTPIPERVSCSASLPRVRSERTQEPQT